MASVVAESRKVNVPVPGLEVARDSRAATYLLIALTALAALLRLPFLSHESFWKDELSIWTFVDVPTLGQAIYNGAIVDPHPPLYMVLVHPFVHVFGMSEWAFRLPSALIGIACVPLMFVLGRRMYGVREGLISAAFMAVFYRPIFYSLEARNYIVLGLGSILLGIAWVTLAKRILARESTGVVPLAGYALLAVSAPYSHYFGALLFVTMMGHLLVLAWRAKFGMREVLILGAFVGLMYLPWLPYAAQTFGRSNDSFWIPKPGLRAPLDFFAFFYGYKSQNPLWLIFTLVAIGYVIVGVLQKRSSKFDQPFRYEREMTILLLVWLAVPFFVTLAKSLVSTSFFLNRYFFICMPAAYVAASRGFTLFLNQTKTVAIAVGALLALNTAHVFMRDRVLSINQKADYRQAVDWLKANATTAPTEPVISSQPMLSYYTDGTPALKIVASEHVRRPKTMPGSAEYLAANRPRAFWYLSAIDDAELGKKTPPDAEFAKLGYEGQDMAIFRDIRIRHYSK